MISNSDKATLIESGTYKKYRDYVHEERMSGRLNGGIINAIDFNTYLKNEKIEFYYCHCMKRATNKKRERLAKKITAIVESGGALFLTLTFTNELLDSTSQLTRRRYVSRYLKDNCKEYVANIDFGGDKGREHYHAVVLPKSIVKLQEWHKLGAINFRHIRTNANQPLILSRYITKLTSHALKSTTNNFKIIYSRY